MKKYSYILALSDELISAVNSRDALTMQQKIDELEAAYKTCFGNRLDCFEAFHAFVKMQLAAMRYFAYNNQGRRTKIIRIKTATFPIVKH